MNEDGGHHVLLYSSGFSDFFSEFTRFLKRNKSDKLLFDIQQAALDIEQFVHGVEYSEFENSNLLQAAVERKFEIIGEALNRIKRFDSKFIEKITDYRRIIGFRNIIAHGYDIIECEVIWAACQEASTDFETRG